MRQCKELPGRKYTEQGLCWVYFTPYGKGGASGMLNVPNPDSRPRWAAYAEFKANVDQSGTLTDFTASTERIFNALKDKPGRKILFVNWAGADPLPKLIFAPSS